MFANRKNCPIESIAVIFVMNNAFIFQSDNVLVKIIFKQKQNQREQKIVCIFLYFPSTKSMFKTQDISLQCIFKRKETLMLK